MIQLGLAGFVFIALLSGEAADARGRVLGILAVQVCVTIAVTLSSAYSEKYFSVVHLLLAVVNYSGMVAMMIVAGGYPTLLWMTALFGVYPSAFFVGRVGAFVNAGLTLAALLAPHGASVDAAVLAGAGTQALILAFLGLAAVSMFRSIAAAEARHRRAALELETANRDLAEAVSALDLEADKRSVVNEMSDLLQSSADTREAFSILTRFGARLFPGHSGAFFLYRNSRDALELEARFGDSHAEPLGSFTPEQCWALRRGRTYHSFGRPTDIVCPHVSDSESSRPETLCVPLLAQGEILGVFHLWRERTPVSPSADQEAARAATDETLAVTVGRDGALALANLRLRESLRNQALRDPLTQLHNRRYLEESLPREIHRAASRDHPLALAMLDIDDFKQFNDAYGHDAGDAVLREVGAVLRVSTRAEDLACRYGGEEFVIVFVETSLAVAVERANQIRERLSALNVEHGGRTLGKVTASLGVVAMPETRGEEMLATADRLLYRAKAEGRDRVVSGSA